MSLPIPKFIETKTLIINAMKASNKTYMSIAELQKLIGHIYTELRNNGKLQEYQISFNINLASIEKTVNFNNNILGIDENDGIIYLQRNKDLDTIAKHYELDKTVYKMVKQFVNSTHDTLAS